MCAGSIIHKTGKTQVPELQGVGLRMPGTLWCFTLASVGLVGVPPCLGFLSKWYLAQGALEITTVPGFFNWLAPAVLLISALLTAGYLLPVSIRGFFAKEKGDLEKCEVSWKMLLPVIVLTSLSVVLGLCPQPLMQLFTSLSQGLM